MNENFCIAIPINSTNLDELQQKIEHALEYNPGFVELRFDYIPNVDNLTKGFIESLKSFLQRDAFSIFTFRHESEGGKIRIDNFSRTKILKLLVEQKPDFLDIEMNSNNQLLSEIINLSIMEKVNLIFSHHNTESTPSLQEAKEKIFEFEERIVKNKLDEFEILRKIVYKIIFTAQKIEDNFTPLNLCQEFSRGNKKVVSFCMGDLGILSRLFCVKFGSFLTYAALEQKTADGQIPIKTFQQLDKLFFNK